MKKADLSAVTPRHGIPYPEGFTDKTDGRTSWGVTGQFGLRQFGVNRVELAPGAWSTERHWHRTNDELVIVISGELTLVTDDGEEIFGPGDCVGFRMNDPNAHHFQNRSDAPAIYFDIGGRDPWDVSTFPDAGFEARTHMEVKFRPLKR
jgi:uncharacterized cupin superfamily protein